MKFNNAFFYVVFFLFMGCNTSIQKILNDESESEIIKVMTYNIRLDTASDGENAWPNRKEFLSSQILFLSPDVLGVQEALPNQIQDLNSVLPNYSFIGEARDGNGVGEYSAIYYNSKKLKVEEQHTFWLSETPDKVSKGWDAAYPRICTYGLFTSFKTNKKFWVFNTHLDHVGNIAKKEGMKLILEKIAVKNTDNNPVIVMGDLNVESSSEVISETKKTLIDSKKIAKVKFGPEGTFNGFKYTEPVLRRIDYIFVSKSTEIDVEKYSVLSSAIDFKFPSDHFPVFTELKIN